MVVTLITGPAGVGKDTFYEKIKNNRTVRLAFADFLKEQAVNIAGWDGEKDEKGRRLLQVLGDVVREYNINRFVEIIADEIKYLNEHTKIDRVVITDCRYDNEVEALRQLLPFNIDIELIELKRKFKSPLSKENAQHPSEAGLSEYVKTKYCAQVVDLDEVEL